MNTSEHVPGTWSKAAAKALKHAQSGVLSFHDGNAVLKLRAKIVSRNPFEAGEKEIAFNGFYGTGAGDHALDLSDPCLMGALECVPYGSVCSFEIESRGGVDRLIVQAVKDKGAPLKLCLSSSPTAPAAAMSPEEADATATVCAEVPTELAGPVTEAPTT